MQRIGSPPSRGAWIEIVLVKKSSKLPRSPPSRGAWIEIVNLGSTIPSYIVAPLAGGVD